MVYHKEIINSRTNFKDLVHDVILIIVIQLKYDDIISLFTSDILPKEFHDDRSFWIYYLKKVYNINRIDSTWGLSQIKRGVQIAEKSEYNYVCDIYDSDYDHFLIKLYADDRQLDSRNLINLTHLNLGCSEKPINLSNMIMLSHLNLGYNNEYLDLSKNINLTYLNLGHNCKRLDLSKNIKLMRLNFGCNWRLLDLSKNINLTDLNIGCYFRSLDLSNLTNLVKIKRGCYSMYNIEDNPNNFILPEHLMH